MKTIKRETSASTIKLTPWFETMGQQIGLSQRTIDAIMADNQSRIRKLNKEGARHVRISMEDHENYKQVAWGIGGAGQLAMILQRCTYIPCGSQACSQCVTAKQLHQQAIDLYGDFNNHRNHVIVRYSSTDLSAGDLLDMHTLSWSYNGR